MCNKDYPQTEKLWKNRQQITGALPPHHRRTAQLCRPLETMSRQRRIRIPLGHQPLGTHTPTPMAMATPMTTVPNTLIRTNMNILIPTVTTTTIMAPAHPCGQG